MTYAITNPEGITTYNITYEKMMTLRTEGSRLWQSDNGGINYQEIFVSNLEIFTSS
jgi:hypothetical protein